MFKLTTTSLDWALAHVKRYGDTDVLHTPFEFEAIAADWESVRNGLAVEEQLSRVTRPLRTFLAPKGKFAFRSITQLDPLDLLTFTALVKDIAAPLEASRIPTSEHIVFSSRYTHDASGAFFDSSVGYTQFAELSLARALSDASVTHVVVADIADFYPRVYIHRLENLLKLATAGHAGLEEHVTVLIRMLLSWNASESIGIPIGSAATRLLAEILLSDIDLLLRAEGLSFVRYVDDYRIFCRSRDDAFRALVRLAETLQHNHRLFLQPQKTAIFSCEEFVEKFGKSKQMLELDSLRHSFATFLAMSGITDPYQALEYEDLPDTAKTELDRLNLLSILEAAVSASPEPDYATVRFVLGRMAQLQDVRAVDPLLSRLATLSPALPGIAKYLRTVGPLLGARANSVGTAMLDALEQTSLGALPYNQVLVADLLSSDRTWGSDGRVLKLAREASSQMVRREFMIALRHSSVGLAWFQEQWRDLDNQPPWTRRALLAGAIGLPAAGRKAYVSAWRHRLDPLERAVATWVGQAD